MSPQREDTPGEDAAGTAPQLSVVIPVYDVEDYLDACIASVVEQSFTDLEVILVDDGSTDGSRAVAESWAAREDRVRLLTQANAGLGAARNTGIASARGEFLAFVDSDDLLLPGAYARMVRTLRKTGSDFVVGAYLRGNERRTYRPSSIAGAHAVRLECVTVDEHPEMVRNITAWNKVFRRSFWDEHALGFPEGVRYEDQAIITKAIIRSSGFDVLTKPVYLWRVRDEGTSITQQKGSRIDLEDRLRSLTDCWELVSTTSEAVQDAWYAKWLGMDFQGYFEFALSGTSEYRELLRDALATMQTGIRASALVHVPLYPRMMCWLLVREEQAAAEALFLFNRRVDHRNGWPVVRVDGEPHVSLPLPQVRVPQELTRVTDADHQPQCRLLRAHWEGQTLVMRGSAFLTYLSGDAGERALEIVLRDQASGKVVPASVTALAGKEFDLASRRRHEDHDRSGFEARVDAGDLVAGESPPGDWRIEVTQTFDRVRHTTGFSAVSQVGTAAARSSVLVEDRLVRLTGSATEPVTVRVGHPWSMVTGTAPIAPGRVAITVRGPQDDPLLRMFYLEGDRRVTLTPTGSDETELTVELAAPGSVTRLRGRHRSGARSMTVLAEGLDACPDADGAAFLYAASGRAAQLGPVTTKVVVEELTAAPDAIRLTGVCLPVPGATVRLRLAGARAASDPSEPLGAGRFEVSVPVVADPWGLGSAPLPAQGHLLEVVDDPSAPVLMGSGLRAHPPEAVVSGGQFWRLGGGEGRIHVRSETHGREQGGVRREQLLEERYVEQRAAEALPAVLFDCFSGRSVGDSQLAIHRELVRRGTHLDLVWGVHDWSLRAPDGGRAVLRGSSEWFELLARARYLVAGDHLPPYVDKASGQTVLQTWHGTPLRVLGYDAVADTLVSQADASDAEVSADGWDQLVSPSPYCSEVFASAFHHTGPLLEVGAPRNDVLVAPDRDARRARARADLGLADDRRVVLYAPTWRRTRRRLVEPVKRLFLDPDELTRAAPDVSVLVRGHPLTADSPSLRSADGGPVLDVTLHPDLADLLLAADILVTDYSSVMFDFALLDRPIHLLTPDLADYREQAHGFYLDLQDVAPGPVFADPEELVAAIASPAEDTWGAARSRLRERFAPLDDGRASARVVDAVFAPSGDDRPR